MWSRAAERLGIVVTDWVLLKRRQLRYTTSGIHRADEHEIRRIVYTHL